MWKVCWQTRQNSLERRGIPRENFTVILGLQIYQKSVIVSIKLNPLFQPKVRMKNSQKLWQVNFNFEEINHRATKIMNSYLYMVNIIMTHFASTKFISIKYIKFKNSQEFHRLYLAFPIGRFRASKNQDPLHFCTSNKNVHKLLLYIKWNDSTFQHNNCN